MKNKFTQVLSIAGFIFIIGCTNSEQKQASDTKTNAELLKHSGVELDNGKKWLANAETTQSIEQMIEIINQVPDNADLNDYHVLKPKLENQMNLIFENCTMTGDAHEQLHNYLIPMSKIIEYLASKDIEFCKMSVNELKDHLSEYKTYFE